MKHFIKENDIRNIADWGLVHIRLPIDYNVIEMKLEIFLK